MQIPDEKFLVTGSFNNFTIEFPDKKLALNQGPSESIIWDWTN